MTKAATKMWEEIKTKMSPSNRQKKNEKLESRREKGTKRRQKWTWSFVTQDKLGMVWSSK